MKNLSLFTASIFLLWSCTTKTTPETTVATDSVVTTASVVTETSEVSEAESTGYSYEDQTDVEEVYGDVGDDFQGDYEGDDLATQDLNGVVHFLSAYSENPYPISMFNENDNAVADVPAFLNAKGIKYSLEKIEASSDPEDYESTDIYTYTFGESVIIISYGDVNEATIYSPEIELQDGVKVGMTKDDFIALFTQVQPYSGADSYQLHTHSWESACYLKFDFENGKIKSIGLKIFVQDCG